MTQHEFMRRIATHLRKMPWLLAFPYFAYRLFQPKYSIGVIGVIFDDQGRVLLVEHVFHARKPWGLPGGWISRNENPAHTVQREVKEELQLTVTVERLLLAEVVQRNHLDIAYLCQQVDTIGTLSSELLDYRWVDPHDLPPLVEFHHKAIERALELELSK